MTTESKPSDIKCSRAYWSHGVIGPYTLKAEQRLGVLIGFDRRLTPAAGVVFRFLLSWDMEPHGNALASVDFISAALKAQDPAGIGLSSSAVGAALKLLRGTGWITQTYRGTGPKNASRYQLAWEALAMAEKGAFPSIVANRPDIVDSAEPSTHSGQYRPHIVDASAENRPDIVEQDSLTDAPKEAPTVSSDVSAPAPGAGLAAAPGGAGEFDRCWIAYGRYGFKQASRRAFEAIENPDVDLIIQRATAWAASARPGQRRMPFEKWLAAEKYDEADRSLGVAAKKSKLSTTTTPKPRPRKAAAPTTTCITASEIVAGGGITELRFTATDKAGAISNHVVVMEHNDFAKQEEGRRLFSRLENATGLVRIEDTADLLGRTIVLTYDEDEFAAPTTRPDGEPPLPVKPEPVRQANQTENTESAAKFAERMAATLNNDASWPDWMDAA